MVWVIANEGAALHAGNKAANINTDLTIIVTTKRSKSSIAGYAGWVLYDPDSSIWLNGRASSMTAISTTTTMGVAQLEYTFQKRPAPSLW